MGGKPLVLVIEDQKNIRKLVSMALSTNGYRVAEAKTGREGLSMAAVYAPDLILLDLGLPDISGWEVLRGIRERSSSPVGVDTADGREEDKRAARAMGADYIAKPFTVPELLARLEAAIRRAPHSIGGSYPI